MSFLRDNLLNARLWNGLMVLGSLVTIIIVNNFSGRLVSGILGNYILPSLLWVLLAAAVYFWLPKGRRRVKRRHRQMFCWAALICGIAGVLTILAAGLLDGFGRSPYDQSALGIMINLFSLAFMLIGMELSRSWLINVLFSKRPGVGIAVIGIILTFFSFPLRRLVYFPTALDGVQFAGGTYLPALMENLLATYLVFLGGPLPAIIYRGTLLAFQWFSPILPDLNWITRALIGTFAPAFCMVLLYQLHRTEVLRERSRDQDSPAGWIVTSAVSVITIWFAVGVFSYFPTAIVTGSMSPDIAVGDVVIVRKVTPEEIELNDIIQFKVNHASITHRVIDYGEEEGRPVFKTKGDANANTDVDPVFYEQITGKVVYVIPKAGWPTIWLRSPENTQPVDGS